MVFINLSCYKNYSTFFFFLPCLTELLNSHHFLVFRDEYHVEVADFIQMLLLFRSQAMVIPVSAFWFNGPAFPLLPFYWVPHCLFYKYWHLTLYMLIFQMTAKCYRSYQETLKFYKPIWGWEK